MKKDLSNSTLEHFSLITTYLQTVVQELGDVCMTEARNERISKRDEIMVEHVNKMAAFIATFPKE